MTTVTLALGVIFLMIGGLYISSRSATNAKKGMQCIAFKTDESFKEIRLALTNEKIALTDMLWTPGQKAYSQPGVAENSPREIWIKKIDSEKAKQIIEAKFKIETTPTAIIVS